MLLYHSPCLRLRAPELFSTITLSGLCYQEGLRRNEDDLIGLDSNVLLRQGFIICLAVSHSRYMRCIRSRLMTFDRQREAASTAGSLRS